MEECNAIHSSQLCLPNTGKKTISICQGAKSNVAVDTLFIHKTTTHPTSTTLFHKIAICVSYIHHPHSYTECIHEFEYYNRISRTALLEFDVTYDSRQADRCKYTSTSLSLNCYRISISAECQPRWIHTEKHSTK